MAMVRTDYRSVVKVAAFARRRSSVRFMRRSKEDRCSWSEHHGPALVAAKGGSGVHHHQRVETAAMPVHTPTTGGSGQAGGAQMMPRACILRAAPTRRSSGSAGDDPSRSVGSVDTVVEGDGLGHRDLSAAPARPTAGHCGSTPWIERAVKVLIFRRRPPRSGWRESVVWTLNTVA